MRKDEAAGILEAARRAASLDLRRSLAESGLSRKAMAEMLGVSYHAFHGYINGEYQPRADVFLAAREIARREKERGDGR